MEPVKDILGNIVNAVTKNHEIAMEKLAKEGKHIGLERVFRREIEKRYGVKVFAFTDQERGNLTHLVADLGAENASAFLIDCVAKWKDLQAEEYLKFLPPTPVFKDLFYSRQKIQSGIISLQKREERRTAPIEQRKAQEEAVKETQEEVRAKPPINFQAMALEEIRKEKERKAALAVNKP